MKWSQLVRMAAHNLVRRRGRTLLNLFGVVVGCTTLLMATAGGTGVRQAIRAMFDASPDARRIRLMANRHVNPDDAPPDAVLVEGDMSGDRQDRIRHQLARQWAGGQSRSADQHFITPEQIGVLSDLEHVDEVVPYLDVGCDVAIGEAQESSSIAIVGDEVTRQQERIVIGRSLTKEDQDGVLIHEFLAYRMGYRSDQELQSLIGRQLTLKYDTGGNQLGSLYYGLRDNAFEEIELSQKADFVTALRKISHRLDDMELSKSQRELLERLFVNVFGDDEEQNVPTDESVDQETAIETRTLTIRGIYHSYDPADLWSLFRRHMGGGESEISVRTPVALEIFLASPTTYGFWGASAMVESTGDLPAAEEELHEAGVGAHSALPLLRSIDRQIDRSVYVVYGIAGLILLVTGLGIFNTMVISVLERTPEFGIMKALGARDRDILKLMLLEGVVCGAVGAVIAVAVSLLLSVAGQQLLRLYVESRTRTDVLGELFSFSALAVLATVVAAIVVCSVASVLPAWRAARLDPVVAMRRT